jgi:glycosyltransferase involved in cell wall biosynthesis
MIAGHDILCFAPGPWDDIWRNRHQIMTRLARANRVLYVEPWPYLRPVLRRLRHGPLRQAWAGLHGTSLRQLHSNLYVYQPSARAPRAGREPLLALMQAVYVSRLRRVLRELGYRSPILWSFLPDTEILLGQFGEKLAVYHVVDEYSGYAGVTASWRPMVQRMEERLLRRVDLVFVVSPALLERKARFNEQTVLVPNGVDYAVFAAAQDTGTRPADLTGVAAPVVGYVGAINEKLDLALLADAARECADVSWILVGPVAVTGEESLQALAELRAMPHVHLLGRKCVNDVPNYVAACDVCVLPYRVNEWTRHIDSLKLWEYLACGKPVVATDIPTARQFVDRGEDVGPGSIIRIATTREHFVQQVRAGVQEHDPALPKARQSIAAMNTWDMRVEALSEAIDARLSQLGRS